MTHIVYHCPELSECEALLTGMAELHMMSSQRLIQSSAISYDKTIILEEEIKKKYEHFEAEHSLQPKRS